MRGNHDTRIGVGMGSSNGKSALSVGVQHSIGTRAAINLIYGGRRKIKSIAI